jgi:hypothetical protein
LSICGWCGKEILPEEEEYKNINGEKILQPHKKCIEEMKEEINDSRWKPKQWKKKE